MTRRVHRAQGARHAVTVLSVAATGSLVSLMAAAGAPGVTASSPVVVMGQPAASSPLVGSPIDDPAAAAHPAEVGLAPPRPVGAVPLGIEPANQPLPIEPPLAEPPPVEPLPVEPLPTESAIRLTAEPEVRPAPAAASDPVVQTSGSR